jgi:hypothetical protein
MCICNVYRYSAIQREALTKRRERGCGLWLWGERERKRKRWSVKRDFTTFISHFLENKIIENVRR